MCHKLEGPSRHQILPPTDYLSITTIFHLPHNLIKGDECQRGNFLFFVWWGLGYVALEDRLQRLLGALFSNAELNRIIETVAVRRLHAYGRGHRCRTRTFRFAIPPRRYGRAKYTASVRLRSRPTRHDTRQMQNSLANSQHPLFFYFILPLFHQPGCGACSPLSRIAASLAQSSDRMGGFFLVFCRGTPRVRKREEERDKENGPMPCTYYFCYCSGAG